MAIKFDFREEKKDDDDDMEGLLSAASAVNRLRMVVDHFGVDSVTVLTSFGVQSGIMMALVAEACPEVRVLYINTQGPTSERDLEYGRRLLDVLGLKNFTVAKAGVTREEFRAGMEEVGITPDVKAGDRNVFHRLSQDIFKVTPLKQECVASGVKCLLSGVRRGQTNDRDHFNFIQYSQGDPAKAHPILDWSDEACLEFLCLKNIPPHPELKSLLCEMNNASKVADGATVGPQQSKRLTSVLRSKRPSERGENKECGIHAVQTGGAVTRNNPVPAMPNILLGKASCRFCVAAKKLLAELDIDYVEAPVHLFSHLIPAGTKTVPVVYLNKTLVGGYGDLCEYLEVEDDVNTK